MLKNTGMRLCAGQMLLLATVGCLGSTEPVFDRDYAFLILEGRAEETGYTTEPAAVFYRTGPLILPSAVVSTDTCVVLPRDLSRTPSAALFLDAGPSVTLSLSGQTVELEPQSDATGTAYILLGDPRMPFTPGDVATLTVPGAPNGFPALTLSGRTAEAFTLEPVAVPAADESLTLTWSPVPPPAERQTKMTFELRYTSLQGSTEVAFHVYCELVDDGQHTIAPDRLIGWRTAVRDEREVIALRWRVTSQSVPGGGVAQVLSVFETRGVIAQ